MILTLDIGNSTMKIIAYTHQDDVIFERSSKTYKEPDELFYQEFFQDLKRLYNYQPDLIIVSSVVPKITKTIIHQLEATYQVKVFNVDTKLTHHLKIKLTDPKELGADFISSAYAAMERYKQPTIIVDMGSASKISVVDEQETFLGGIIQPGVGLMANCLHQEIPHLPNIDLALPQQIIGYDTISSIESGIVMGSWYAMAGLSERIARDIGRDSVKLLTGGYSNIYTDIGEFIHVPNLVNEGLLAIVRRYDLYDKKESNENTNV